MKIYFTITLVLSLIYGCVGTEKKEAALVEGSSLVLEPRVRLTEAEWHGTGCYKIEMEMGTVYFEKDNGVSGFKSFIDNEGNDWIASYLEPGPNGDFRGFPNSVGNFGHAGRDSGSTTKIVDGKTEGEVVILESTNGKFTFQYWFFADRVAIKVLESEGEYCFLLEGVAGGTADAEDYFVTADGKKHIPTEDGEFDDFTPEWFYLGDHKAENHLFLAKTPNDNAPNENHRQIRPGGEHNMDLYSFGRAGKEEKYKVYGMSGNEHVCIIGFVSTTRTHNEITAMLEGFMGEPFTSGVRWVKKWSNKVLKQPEAWYASDSAIALAKTVIQYQSSQGGWPKSIDLARPPLTPRDIPAEGGGRANSFDNDATTVPMEFLARVITATGDEELKASFNKGLDYLFAAQYPTGGWPQFWPLRGDKYYSRITYNDEAMIRVMRLLQGVVDKEKPFAFVDVQRIQKAKEAVNLGIECILNTQIKQNGNLTVWCAQYHEETLEPAWARAYEPPSLSGSESVDIVEYLMSLENPSPEIITSVKSAVKWLRENAIIGVRLDHRRNPDGRNEAMLVEDPDADYLWARFYELETNRPLYLDRDSKFRYDFSEISYERRSGYGYHGYWADDLIHEDYHEWLSGFSESDTIEAESGTYEGKTNTAHKGFTGTSYVDVHHGTGTFIEINYDAEKAGSYMLGFRVALGKQEVRPAKVEENGALARQNINFYQTGNWDDWEVISVPVQLKKGKNAIRFTGTWVNSLPNVDHFILTPES